MGPGQGDGESSTRNVGSENVSIPIPRNSMYGIYDPGLRVPTPRGEDGVHYIGGGWGGGMATLDHIY